MTPRTVITIVVLKKVLHRPEASKSTLRTLILRLEVTQTFLAASRQETTLLNSIQTDDMLDEQFEIVTESESTSQILILLNPDIKPIT